MYVTNNKTIKQVITNKVTTEILIKINAVTNFLKLGVGCVSQAFFFEPLQKFQKFFNSVLGNFFFSA